ncbi:MAG: hypothetical protein K2Z81_09225, partial [Cyanobacteria bacterium]|nr:hypothetical protein [Cyanobacteriota bacterium]
AFRFRPSMFFSEKLNTHYRPVISVERILADLIDQVVASGKRILAGGNNVNRDRHINEIRLLKPLRR